MASPWRIVLTDMEHKPVDEIRQFVGLNYVRALSKVATCSFTTRLDYRHVDRLFSTEGYIKLYRGTSLRMYGPIVSAEQSVTRDAQTLAVTCADQGWVLGKRIAGKSGTGTKFETPLDVAQIAKSLIDTTNTMNNTKISTNVVTMAGGSARTYIAGPYRSILEIVSELGSALDGFDWRIVPIENWSNGALTGAQIGYIEALPIIGTNKPLAIFEYGADTRANILSYTRTRTRDTQANRVFHIGDDPANAMFRDNAASQTVWGHLEDIIAQGDIKDAGMRTSLLDEHVAIRGNPRDLVKMTPHIDPGVTGRMPFPFVDYDIGDTITARIVYADKVRFDGQLRVYAITVNVEETTGFERVELTLEDEA